MCKYCFSLKLKFYRKLANYSNSRDRGFPNDVSRFMYIQILQMFSLLFLFLNYSVLFTHLYIFDTVCVMALWLFVKSDWLNILIYRIKHVWLVSCQSWVRTPPKALVVSLSKKLYPPCLVLVGSRNGCERDFTTELK